MNRDFAEMLSALFAEEAEFLIVGAHALAAYGVPRSTGDLNILIRATEENALRVWRALESFGAPLERLSLEDLATPGTVFQIGLPPARIDLLTEITGVTYDEAIEERVTHEVAGVLLPFIGRAAFIRNKKALGRAKDLADVEALLD